jgi:MFS transporter, DHA2 family, glioxin efflux transporter
MLTRKALFVAISGAAISRLGQFVPFLIIGSVLTTVGTGLIYTLNVDSGSSHWIGFQALAGIGIGLCFQVPIMAAQAVVAEPDVPLATAIVLCEFFISPL